VKANRSNLITVFICALLLLLFGPLVYAIDLDASFDSDGIVTTDFGGTDQIWSVAIQSDGKIVVAGQSDSEFGLARYTTAGALDTTFGSGGIVTTIISGTDRVLSVVIQSDGKIIAAGYSNNNFALARYTTAGALDTTFDSDGIVTTDFGSTDQIWSVAIQSDGMIIAVGSSNDNFALARYTTTGALDTTFDTDGKVTTDFGSTDRAHSVAIQSDGMIVAVGDSYSGTDYDFALARYTTAGALDTTFDTDGKVTTDFGSTDQIWSVAIQTDGKIVAVGKSDTDFALARYTTAGALDTTFDTDGKVTTDFGSTDWAHSVAIQSDGKIIAAGYSNNNFALARYTTAGALDTTFDTDGKVTTDFGSTDRAHSVAIQSDGKIVAAGFSNNNFALIRYGPANPVSSLSSNSENKTVNSSISGYTVSSTGGAISSYSISPAAPAGLTFNTTTGLLSGSPTVVAAATTYTISGINEMGSSTQTFTLTVTAQATTTDNSAALAAAAAEEAKRAKEQKELTEILSIIPKIGELTLGLGKVTKTLTSTKCVKGKSIKFVKRSGKCPKGFTRTR
jgi:uncharacterized delta-60 repeat protein